MIRSSTRRARKPHQCERCLGAIEPGALYLESVASPGHDDLDNQTWWRLAECADCATRCGRPLQASVIAQRAPEPIGART